MITIDHREWVPEQIMKGIAAELERAPEQLKVQMNECLKFLYASASFGKTFIPLNKEGDEVWHQLILQTEFYQDLCRRLPSGKFRHHQPIGLTAYSELTDRHDVVSKLLEWVPVYVQTYGPFSEEASEYWVIVQFLKDEVGMTLDEINELGSRTATQLIVTP